MPLMQFRRITSELALPEDIHVTYDKICRQCDQCLRAKPAPSRARVSGIRADNFGDLVFVDHADVDFRGHKFCVLLVLDAASSLLSVHPQRSKEE